MVCALKKKKNLATFFENLEKKNWNTMFIGTEKLKGGGRWGNFLWNLDLVDEGADFP